MFLLLAWFFSPIHRGNDSSLKILAYIALLRKWLTMTKRQTRLKKERIRLLPFSVSLQIWAMVKKDLEDNGGAKEKKRHNGCAHG